MHAVERLTVCIPRGGLLVQLGLVRQWRSLRTCLPALRTPSEGLEGEREWLSQTYQLAGIGGGEGELEKGGKTKDAGR